jgi:hypothetical protein
MRATILLALLAVVAASAAPAAEPDVELVPAEPVTAEDIAKLKALGPNAIFIADGHAKLFLHVSVVDSVSQAPIIGAKVSVKRDRRVARHLGRTYKSIPSRATDGSGRATVRGEFPMAADAEGSSVFVLDSYVEVEAVGHVAGRGRLSPIYKLDFPRGTERCEVPLQIALKPR